MNYFLILGLRIARLTAPASTNAHMTVWIKIWAKMMPQVKMLEHALETLRTLPSASNEQINIGSWKRTFIVWLMALKIVNWWGIQQTRDEIPTYLIKTPN